MPIQPETLEVLIKDRLKGLMNYRNSLDPRAETERHEAEIKAHELKWVLGLMKVHTQV